MEGAARRQWWIPLAFVVPPGILALLVATEHRLTAWLIYGSWVVVVAAVIVRAFRADAYRVRRAAAPLGAAGEAYQDVLLARPPRRPIAYGPDDDAVSLVVDDPPHDPGDLTGR